MPEKIPFRLLPVPSFQHELTIKANQSGITVLKDGRYRKRYTGSKHSAIDINGKMYLNASELKKLCINPADKRNGRQKKRPDPLNGLERSNEDNQPPREKNYKVHKTEVRNRLLTMINTIKGKKELYFWTVTFPMGTNDATAYRLYNIWLTTLRQKKWLRNYLWIAERQQNGTVHFHIAIPHQLSIVAANNAMRTVLRTAAIKKEIPFHVSQCKRYNGIDIAKHRTTRRVTNFAIKKGSRSLANYLTKYITKNDSTFPHLAWHNSRGFSSLFTGITFTTKEFIGYGFRGLVKPGVIINNEYFMFFGWKDLPPYAVTKHLYEINSWIQQQNE
jgi:hypothetical protein